MWQKAVKVYMVASLSTYVQSMLQQNKNKYEQLVGGLNPSEKTLVNWDDDISNIWEKHKLMFQSPPTRHNPIISH